MSVWLISAVTMAYIGVAISEGLKKNYGMCVAFVSYATANIGLMMAMK